MLMPQSGSRPQWLLFTFLKLQAQLPTVCMVSHLVLPKEALVFGIHSPEVTVDNVKALSADVNAQQIIHLCISGLGMCSLNAHAVKS